MTDLANQIQEYKGQLFSICDLIEAAKDISVEEVEIRFIYKIVDITTDNTVADFAKHLKQANDSNLKYPILLCPQGFVLDGKHRLAKAISLGYEKIKVKQFRTMPNIGFKA